MVVAKKTTVQKKCASTVEGGYPEMNLAKAATLRVNVAMKEEL